MYSQAVQTGEAVEASPPYPGLHMQYEIEVHAELLVVECAVQLVHLLFDIRDFHEPSWQAVQLPNESL